MKLKFLSGIFAVAFLLSPAVADEVQPQTDGSAAPSTAVKPRETAPDASLRKPAAAPRVSMMGTGPIRSTTTPAPVQPVVAATTDLQCEIGQYPKAGKCVACNQKNNPGVRWANPGKDCKISSCLSAEYQLVDKDKEQPQCLQKCNVWGGVASREWVSGDAAFSFCGSGKYLECEGGFAKTRERTGGSGTEYGHCVVDGSMVGVCKEDGRMNPGKFENGQCMQVCENGFWSGCSISKFCSKGFHEDNFRDTIFIKDKKDSKTSIFDCVPN